MLLNLPTAPFIFQDPTAAGFVSLSPTMPMSPASPLMTFQIPPKAVVKLGKGVGKKAAAKQGSNSKFVVAEH